MKIGVKLGPALDSGVARAAIEAERLGFDSVWLSERIVTPLDRPHPYEPMIDPWIGLAYVAAVTERVRLGTAVSQIVTRPPVLMARELATLDRLSGGRLIVGAGAGWVAEEFIATGVPFADRGGRLNEHIRLMRHLWTTPSEPWDGRYYQIPAVGIVAPLTPGGPPIYAGALTEAGFRRIAKYCDGFIAIASTVEQVTQHKARIDALRTRYGRTGPFEVLVQTTPPESVDDAKTLARAYHAAGVSGLIVTYPAGVPDGFLAVQDVTRALIESAGALP